MIDTSPSACPGCGVEGHFAGDGQCDDCLKKSVDEVLQDATDNMHAADQSQIETPIRVDPSQFADSGIPEAPKMNRYGPEKVEKSNPVLSSSASPKAPDNQWEPQKFSPVQPDFEKDLSTRSGTEVSGLSTKEALPLEPNAQDLDLEQAAVQVPTTVMKDQRMKQFQSPIPNWDGWKEEQANSNPATIKNEFNDEFDWSNLARSKSIAISTSQKKGGEPQAQVKTDGNQGAVVEIRPDQPIGFVFPTTQQSDPKFEVFTLDDLFPSDMQPGLESPLPQQFEQGEPVVGLNPTPTYTPPPAQTPARSVMEEEEIDWGLPNQKPTLQETGAKEYSLVDESANDGSETNWGDNPKKSDVDSKRSDSEREPSDDNQYEDESIYEDEEGELDENTDFSQSNTHDFGTDNISTRSEKDIIEELRNSTVPNQVVFDRTPEIVTQKLQRAYQPITLNAKPVPHYEELLRLSQMKEQSAVHAMNQNPPSELPAKRRTRAIPASSQRIIEAAEDFDFQPLPGLILPAELGLEEFDMDEFGSQAFDPESILPVAEPTEAFLQVEQAGISTEMFDTGQKRNVVPIILKAAPSFVGSDEDSGQTNAATSNAKIRFIKPSFKRELNK